MTLTPEAASDLAILLAAQNSATPPLADDDQDCDWDCEGCRKCMI